MPFSFFESKIITLLSVISKYKSLFFISFFLCFTLLYFALVMHTFHNTTLPSSCHLENDFVYLMLIYTIQNTSNDISVVNLVDKKIYWIVLGSLALMSVQTKDSLNYIFACIDIYFYFRRWIFMHSLNILWIKCYVFILFVLKYVL